YSIILKYPIDLILKILMLTLNSFYDALQHEFADNSNIEVIPIDLKWKICCSDGVHSNRPGTCLITQKLIETINNNRNYYNNNKLNNRKQH
ncbi:unnamed protein product, partial [Didymodactylos carnosus]